jgi:class 3 adenylate cyclase
MSETRYAVTADGVHIAYRATGDGPVDLVYLMQAANNLEVVAEHPLEARYLDRLASFSRLIMFDKRGTGLSDRHQTPDLDMRADDLRSVLDAVGSERAVLFGESEGGALAAFFAASHPERALALILYGTLARYAWAPDYPFGMRKEEHLARREALMSGWGTFDYVRGLVAEQAPSLLGDADYIRWWAKLQRHSASPAAALAFEDVVYATDVRSVLGSVQAPTLVLSRSATDGDSPSRDLADRIPGAKYVELPGRDFVPEAGNADDILAAAERFVHSIRAEEVEISRVLATVLFTDVANSTAKAAELGDARWKELVEHHHRTVRAMIGRYRGREIDTAGDGFFATFDGPARAVRCAQAILEAVSALGLQVRAGVHTGEVETIDDKVGGVAVMIGARIGALAASSEVLVSSTVKDLVIGSGINFDDRGEQELKGIPGEWRIYAVDGD